MSDTDTYIRHFKESYPLREPIIRDVIKVLELPPGSRGLDAGCGIGQPGFRVEFLNDLLGCTPKSLDCN